eukprot:TRINITY_DN2426_c0_g1_i2.p1 TRINITY_DN2426_c0_g1~~TRINITY_DN2426_c0_g1_i2.p1  ORF type:complete len:293 (+),score=119.98 TRINITY_DN2426_c0_g1_i2:30-881(+)
MDRIAALGGEGSESPDRGKASDKKSKRLSMGVDTDDDFDEVASGGEEDEEAGGWSDDEDAEAKKKAQETKAEEAEEEPAEEPEAGAKADTPEGDEDTSEKAAPGDTADLADKKKGTEVAPPGSKTLTRIATTEDEAVEMMLKPNSRPGSRIMVSVELDPSIDQEKVKHRVAEMRAQRGMAAGVPKTPEKGDTAYQETDLYKKLHALMGDKPKTEEEMAQLRAEEQERERLEAEAEEKKRRAEKEARDAALAAAKAKEDEEMVSPRSRSDTEGKKKKKKLLGIF